MEIRIVSKSGIIPEYKTPGSAGFDITAFLEEPVTLRPGERRLIPTGLFMEIPEGYEAQVRGRSGLALKNGIGLVNGIGTIDSDYRGEVFITARNDSDETYHLSKGDRIAQIVILPLADVFPVRAIELSTTDRGSGGYGSTGK